MKELVYAGVKVEELIQSNFPDAKIVDASNEIYRERFELEINVAEEVFYRFAIRHRFAGDCLSFVRKALKRDNIEIAKWIQEEDLSGRARGLEPLREVEPF